MYWGRRIASSGNDLAPYSASPLEDVCPHKSGILQHDFKSKDKVIGAYRYRPRAAGDTRRFLLECIVRQLRQDACRRKALPLHLLTRERRMPSVCIFLRFGGCTRM